MQPVSIKTLGDLSTAYQLCGVCNGCRSMRQLAMIALLAKLGPAFPIAGVRSRLRCRECGGRDCGIRMVWVGNDRTY
jgi:hypothetical protein